MPHLIAVLLACIIALALLVSPTTASKKVGCEIGVVGTGLGTIMKERSRTSVSDPPKVPPPTQSGGSQSILEKVEIENPLTDWNGDKELWKQTKDLCCIS